MAHRIPENAFKIMVCVKDLTEVQINHKLVCKIQVNDKVKTISYPFSQPVVFELTHFSKSSIFKLTFEYKDQLLGKITVIIPQCFESQESTEITKNFSYQLTDDPIQREFKGSYAVTIFNKAAFEKNRSSSKRRLQHSNTVKFSSLTEKKNWEQKSPKISQIQEDAEVGCQPTFGSQQRDPSARNTEQSPKMFSECSDEEKPRSLDYQSIKNYQSVPGDNPGKLHHVKNLLTNQSSQQSGSEMTQSTGKVVISQQQMPKGQSADIINQEYYNLQAKYLKLEQQNIKLTKEIEHMIQVQTSEQKQVKLLSSNAEEKEKLSLFYKEEADALRKCLDDLAHRTQAQLGDIKVQISGLEDERAQMGMKLQEQQQIIQQNKIQIDQQAELISQKQTELAALRRNEKLGKLWETNNEVLKQANESLKRELQQLKNNQQVQTFLNKAKVDQEIELSQLQTELDEEKKRVEALRDENKKLKQMIERDKVAQLEVQNILDQDTVLRAENEQMREQITKLLKEQEKLSETITDMQAQKNGDLLSAFIRNLLDNFIYEPDKNDNLDYAIADFFKKSPKVMKQYSLFLKKLRVGTYSFNKLEIQIKLESSKLFVLHNEFQSPIENFFINYGPQQIAEFESQFGLKIISNLQFSPLKLKSEDAPASDQPPNQSINFLTPMRQASPEKVAQTSNEEAHSQNTPQTSAASKLLLKEQQFELMRKTMAENLRNEGFNI